MGTLASYAADANGLTNWAVSVVPGLLQTEDYAMALILSDGVPPDVAELRWVARRRRQKILGTVDYAATSARARYGPRSVAVMATGSSSNICWTPVSAASPSGWYPSTCRSG